MVAKETPKLPGTGENKSLCTPSLCQELKPVSKSTESRETEAGDIYSHMMEAMRKLKKSDSKSDTPVSQDKYSASSRRDKSEPKTNSLSNFNSPKIKKIKVGGGIKKGSPNL